MKVRFFYGGATHNTWPKLFVLTENGRFYCEYLNYNSPSKVIKEFNFETFKQEDYKWEGYQSIVEIDEQKAKNTRLRNQSNWIERYLNSL